MNADRWKQVSRIYGVALAKQGHERGPYLDQVCGDDADLRLEVEALLAESREGDTPLDRPVAALAAAMLGDNLVGRQLGPYQLDSLIGAGGMGQVYRATDTRLHRTVAVKVLRSALADDAQFRARFEREAKAIAVLSHPHICTLHDVGQENGVAFLVMELVDGESLAARLERGRLPFEQALTLAIQIGEALAAAHRQGIVHRDLKPGNVMVTKSGAKLLDFGLAKHSQGPTQDVASLTQSPTLTDGPLTAKGTILGTFQYMAPEQLEGKEADSRTDIFAFGALVYELFTGAKAFEGKSQASLIGAIMHAEPPLMTVNQPLTPASLERLLRTCLAKDPDDRWQSIRDVVRQLREIATARPSSVGAPDAVLAQPRRTFVPWIAAVAIAASVAAVVKLLPGASPVPAVVANIEFKVPAPDGALFGGPVLRGSGPAPQLAISPDGRSLAFVANKGGFAVWVRRFDSAEPQQLAGTEGGIFPFWSPDSQFIGFFADGKLKKVAAAGGTPVVLCDALIGRGGTWNAQGDIVFSPSPSGVLQSVSETGGVPKALTTLDPAHQESNHRFPHFLPDGQHFLFTAVSGVAGLSPAPSRVMLGTLDGGPASEVLTVESSAQYAAGYLLYLGENQTLMARRFDVSRFTLTGDERPIATRIGTEGSRYGAFSVAPAGPIVFADGSTLISADLTWFDRSGQASTALKGQGRIVSVALSRDDRRVAFSGVVGTLRQIFVMDTARNVPTQLTFDGESFSAVWSPDGTTLAFSHVDKEKRGVFVRPLNRAAAADGVALDDTPFEALRYEAPLVTDWSSNGRILFVRAASGGGIAAVSATDGKLSEVVHQANFTTDAATVSMDGRWVAYHSARSGSQVLQVFVRSTDGGADTQISVDGGSQPIWSQDGHELFFMNDGLLMVVPVKTSPSFEAGLPKPLFQSNMLSTGRLNYAVSRDGQRFLVTTPKARVQTVPLTVRTNWAASLP